MAKIYKRKKMLKDKSQTYFVVRFKDEKSQTRDKQFLKKFEAEAFVETLTQKRLNGEFNPDAQMTFEHLSKLFLDAAVIGREGRRPITRKTESSYRNYLNRHVLPEIGKMRIGSIRRSDMSKLVQKLTTTLNRRASARQAFAVVKVCFTHAIELEILQHNPTDKIVVRNDMSEYLVDENGRATPRRPKAPTTDEIKAILKTAKERRDDHPHSQVREAWKRYYLMFLFLIQTGCRSSEMRAIQWGDIKWDDQVIEIQRSADSDTCQIGPLKTPHSYRTIPLPDELFLELRNARGKDEAFVFGGSDSGRPPTHSSISYYFWKPLLGYAGVGDYGLHSLRHYYASFLLKSGVSLPNVKEWLGHYSAAFTIDRYGHVLKEDAKAPASWSKLV